MNEAHFLSKAEVEIAEPIINPEIISQTAVDENPENKALGSINCNITDKAKNINPVKKGGSNEALQQVRVISITAALYENETG